MFFVVLVAMLFIIAVSVVLTVGMSTKKQLFAAYPGQQLPKRYIEFKKS